MHSDELFANVLQKIREKIASDIHHYSDYFLIKKEDLGFKEACVDSIY